MFIKFGYVSVGLNCWSWGSKEGILHKLIGVITFKVTNLYVYGIATLQTDRRTGRRYEHCSDRTMEMKQNESFLRHSMCAQPRSSHNKRTTWRPVLTARQPPIVHVSHSPTLTSKHTWLAAGVRDVCIILGHLESVTWIGGSASLPF